MIDEELYRLAQEELNSDQRRSNIWARACALARDDHDEARYLYTNLRVEEMIAERGKLEQQQADPSEQTAAKEDSPQTSTGQKPSIRIDPAVLAEANQVIQSPSHSEHEKKVRLASRDMADGQFAELDDSSMEQFDSNSNDGNDQVSNLDLSEEAQSLLQDHVAAQKSLSDNDRKKINAEQLSFEAPEPSVEGSVEFGVPEDNSATDALSIDELDLDQFDDDVYNATAHRAKMAAGGSPSKMDSGENEISAGSGLEELDELVFEDTQTISTGNTPTPEDDHPQADVHASDYRPAAKQIPLKTEESMASLEARAREEAEILTGGHSVDGVVTEQALTRAQEFGRGISHDYADNSDLDTIDSRALENEIDSEQALALNSGSGSPYIVFSDESGRTRAVKNGVSWSAFFLTLPWLLSKKLLGTALVYALLWLVILGGLLMSGLVWMDAGSSVTTTTKVAFGLFALMTVVGLFYVPFRFGNSWVADKLVKNGYDYQTPVRAKNRKQAIDKVLRFAT